jgi:two-component system chemotaxis sensor kinase CheA
MPLSPAHYASLEENLNRLAAEIVLAQPGRDDGLVPAYSLLGDLRDAAAGESSLLGPISAVHSALEKMLDTAQPFDEASLGKLRAVVEWLPKGICAIKSGQPVPEMGTASATPVKDAESSGHTETIATDVLLDLHIDENRELLTEFNAETVDHLQQIEAALLALDQQPDNPEALNSIFRSFHTIKGNAGFLGLVPMHTLAHEVESLLDQARNQKLRLNAAIITEILRSRDALQALSQQVALALEKGKLPDQVVPVSHLIVAVKRLALAGTTQAPFEPATKPVPAPAVASVAATAPMGQVTPEPASSGEISPPSAPTPVPATPAAELAPIVPISTSAAETNTVAANAPKKTAAAVVPTKAAAAATVRVNTEKLDSLMDVVGELVIVQSQLIETSRQNGVGDQATLQRNVAQLSRITKELQSTAMALRMIPIKPTFQKMERLARDLARDVGKRVSFVTSGEETELDRTVVEEIGDPLVHMVRNALDHGLEPPAARVAVGKPETGSVHLKAYHQGSNIVIELQDDGRGIDPDRILKKAIEKGLVTENAVLSRDEILALIFAPVFSRA